MALTELEVKYAAKRGKPYKPADGGGLHVLVHPNGSKLWRMKYRFDGKEKLLSFGQYPKVSMAHARARREEAKVLLAAGKDPAVQRNVEPSAGRVSRPSAGASAAETAGDNSEGSGYSG
ncbi:uncharacterized protein DUF4102 [Novosphingobium sp. PhB165]|uniref:Arm DNA-binding domain-containing protein n=1 Tax=Novosphingobium sp. PhB165 TaxID=2485105 RepID=UPI001050B8CD|nr:Arm DNA-binding domain-containing protein [Novosphingobium sp. PhB165]TCM15782.1 uncharacterized protein DUF4102 [Novosphingobium sp. PhB165]